MKKFILFLLFTLIAALTFGQRSNYQDFLCLNNENIIGGIIIKQVPNESIEFETADKSGFDCKIEEIEKITDDPIQGKNGVFVNKSGLQSGYKGIVELGYQIGVGDIRLNRLKLNIINGYQINPYISMGVGTGLRYYYDLGVALIPLFADFRANFMDNYISPYFSFGLGYSFNVTNGFFGVGLLLNPTIGASFKVFKKSAINVGLGYEMQKMKFYYEIFDGYYFHNRYYAGSLDAISINVGISF